MNPGLLDPYWTSDVLMDDDPFTDMTPDDGFMHDFSTAQSRGWYDRRGISRHPNVFCSYFIYYRKHGYVKNTPPQKLKMLRCVNIKGTVRFIVFGTYHS